MNKKDACEFLSISERTLQNLLAANKISSKRVPGKTGMVVEFDRADLERFKEERDQVVHKPALQRMPESEGMQSGVRQSGAEVQSLAALPDMEQFLAAVVSQAVTATLSQVQANRPAMAYQNALQRPPVDVADKLLLTLSEAQQLTGLSRNTLRAAIDAGNLKAKQIGRAFRVKRADLQKYVDKL